MQAIEDREVEITTSTEIRFLPPWAKSQLAHILEVTQGWLEVMGRVPAPPWAPGQPLPQGEHYPRKYSADDVMVVREECGRDHRKGFQALVEEWGSSGRQRPTVADLLALLQASRLYRASHFLSIDILKGEAVTLNNDGEDPETQLDRALEEEDCRSHQQLVYSQPTAGVVQHHPSQVPSSLPVNQQPAQVDPHTLLLDKHLEKDLQHSHNTPTNHQHPDIHNSPTNPLQAPIPNPPEQPTMDATVLQSLDASGFTHFPFSVLQEITHNFSGTKLGEGAFGVVFMARVVQAGLERKVAIKKLNVGELKVEEQFKTEIEVLSKCVHENLLTLVGYSCDGPSWCLLYDYMANGSLQDRLACTGGSEPLGWERRVNIGMGAARGIVHLHTGQDSQLVHRDIKSANILLDQHFTPKVGDFGLVRLGGGGTHTRTLIRTTTVFGTSAYMAPEAFRGDISVMLDTFSYGIVLLELLTGLPSYDENREGCDLLTHIQESEVEVEELVDSRAGEWDQGAAEALFTLADQCTLAKKKRPTMVQVLNQYPTLNTLL